MRYNNIQYVTSIFPDNDGYHYSISKTGKSYYVIIERNNTLTIERFNSQVNAKKGIEDNVKSLCDQMVNLGKWTPECAYLVFEMKQLDINDFKYDTSTD